VRLFERTPGHLEELHDWELILFSGEWRERKGPSVAPMHTRGVSASGRDQYAERLDNNRERFLTECGRLVRAAGSKQGWSEVLAFGTPPEVERFADGIPAADSRTLVAGPAVDLVSEPSTVVLEQVERAFADLDEERDRRLVEQTLEEIRPGGRATGGIEETEAALVIARVERLVLAGGLAPLDPPCEDQWPSGSDNAGEDSETAGLEHLVRQALSSGAEVTVVDDGAADLLGPFQGVAASLRY
jgi:release factor family 10/eRF1-like protein